MRRTSLLEQIYKPINVIRYRDITITNNESSVLSDFQVPIEIGEDFLNKADKNNLIIVENNKILPYWVEEWRYPAGKARIWVKLDLPASGSKTLKLYYQGIEGTNEPDGGLVFDFFDDFSTWENWAQSGSGTLSQSNEVSLFSNCSAKKTGNDDWNGGEKLVGSFGRNIILEAYIFRLNFDGGGSDRIGILNGSSSGYGTEFRFFDDSDTERRPQVGVDKRVSGSGVNNRDYIDKGKCVFNIWYLHRLIIESSNVITEIATCGSRSPFASKTIADTSYSSFSKVYIWGGHDFYVGGIWIRKYTENEPTVSVSSEKVIARGF